MERLEQIEVKPGDYAISVHIIEVRDLHPAGDSNGCADPVVRVECFEQKKTTCVKKATLDAVFDETFRFDLKDADQEMLEGGNIKISVLDQDVLGTSLIGDFVTDFQAVYFNSGNSHELYRKWVALVDTKNEHDVGVQGYLRLSIAIVGPDDKPVYHDLAKEVAEEAKKHPSGTPTQVIMPSVRQKLQFLAISVHQAEGLPIMDIAGVSGHGFEFKSGIDAFLQISFAENDKVESRTIKASPGKGAKRCRVFWNERLKLPVFVPSGSQK